MQCFFIGIFLYVNFLLFSSLRREFSGFSLEKVDVRGKVDVQAPKSQLLYVNIDVPYVNKKTLVNTFL